MSDSQLNFKHLEITMKDALMMAVFHTLKYLLHALTASGGRGKRLCEGVGGRERGKEKMRGEGEEGGREEKMRGEGEEGGREEETKSEEERLEKPPCACIYLASASL